MAKTDMVKFDKDKYRKIIFPVLLHKDGWKEDFGEIYTQTVKFTGIDLENCTNLYPYYNTYISVIDEKDLPIMSCIDGDMEFDSDSVTLMTDKKGYDTIQGDLYIKVTKVINQWKVYDDKLPRLK